jgi:hypothetical protein
MKSGVCVACVNAESPAESTAITACKCKADTWGADGVCKKCTDNSTSDKSDNATIDKCKCSNNHFGSGNTKCTKCPDNSSAAGTGADISICDCVGNFEGSKGVCTCKEGFFGLDCSKSCKKDNGSIECNCNEGFSGTDCAT